MPQDPLFQPLRLGAPLAPHDHNTLFGGDERGLTDYPTLDEIAA